MSLYHNGDATAIEATYGLATDVTSTTADDSDFAWHWDLGGYGEITSYQIVIEANTQNLVYGNAAELTTISASDVFAQAIPEPSSAMMGGNVELLDETQLRDMRHWSPHATWANDPDFIISRAQ